MMLALRSRRARSCLRKLAMRQFMPPASCVALSVAVEHKHAPPHGRQLLFPESSCVGRRRIYYVAYF